MKTDNEWHTGIIYRYTDGDGEFHIAETLDEGKLDPRPKEMIGAGVRYQEIKYNYNRGQPIVDFGEFTMSVVDLGIKRVPV